MEISVSAESWELGNLWFLRSSNNRTEIFWLTHTGTGKRIRWKCVSQISSRTVSLYRRTAVFNNCNKGNTIPVDNSSVSWITSDPKIMMGKPVVVGTRITVELILQKLAAGETIEQVLQAHPRLTRPAILAALEFAAHALRADVIYPVTTQSV